MEAFFAILLALLLVGATYKWRWHPIIVGLAGGVAFSALYAVVDWLRPHPTRTNPLTDFLMYIVIYGLVIIIVCLLVARPVGDWWKEEAPQEESATAGQEESRRF